MAIGLALLGSGIFAKEAHLPAIAKCEGFELKAIYSRSFKSASDVQEAALKVLTGKPEVSLYCDEEGQQSFDDLLKRDDIKAVIIALPIPIQPDFISRALDKGLFVLSEKPIAKDVATAQALIKKYAKTNRWFIAENFCHEESIDKAAEWVQSGRLGKLRMFNLFTSIHVSSTGPIGKYLKTEWRLKPAYQGGFILDGGVHQAAMLRHIFKQDITVKAAITQQFQEELPPTDTVQALLQLSDGTGGTFTQSVGTESSPSAMPPMLVIQGSLGCLEFANKFPEPGNRNRRFAVTFTPVDKAAQPEELVFLSNGVANEVAKFAKVVGGETTDLLKDVTPEEALKDTKLIEDMLNAAKLK